MVAEFKFDNNLYTKECRLFPLDICNDDTIFFHGTSSLCEKEIDEKGFVLSAGFAEKYEVERVVKIFEQMAWYGRDLGGFMVLKAYSQSHDFSKTIPPLFFAETCRRALLYATKNFAGGEKARALRKSIYDLKRYLSCDDMRIEHFAYLENEYQQLIDLNAKLGQEPTEVDLDWLNNEVGQLENMQNQYDKILCSHEYGVVYAIKFSPEDYGFLEYNKTMGLESYSDIPPSKLVAKMKIPPNIKYYDCQNDPFRMKKVTGRFLRDLMCN